MHPNIIKSPNSYMSEYNEYLFLSINFQNINQINVNIEKLVLVFWFA